MKRRPRLRVVVAFKTARSKLARYVTGSFAVHGALLTAVLIVPATRHHAAPIEDTMTVALAGPIAAAPAPSGGAPAVPQVKPAPAPPPPPPKDAHAVHEVPAVKPKEKPQKPTKEPAKAPEKPSPVPPADSSPDTPPGGGEAGPPNAKPGAGSGAGVTATVGGGDSTLGWYGAAVKAALESAWIKPYLEDAQGTASVIVTFDIARDGTTKNFRIQQTSGIPSLDRSAQRAVIEASPLPAVPPTWTGETIPVTMRFDLAPETH